MSVVQAYANNNDWARVLDSFARAVEAALVRVSPPTGRHACLDIGAGFCYNIRHVIGILNYRNAQPCDWVAFEPDAEVAKVVARKTLSALTGAAEFSGLKQVSSWPQVLDQGSGKWSVITLMHSTYHLHDVVDFVRQCIDKHLAPGGSVVILQMAKTSPWLLGQGFARANHVESLRRTFPDARVQTHKVRFRVDKALLMTREFSRALYSWLEPQRLISYQDFTKSVLTKLASQAFVSSNDDIITVSAGRSR